MELLATAVVSGTENPLDYFTKGCQDVFRASAENSIRDAAKGCLFLVVQRQFFRRERRTCAHVAGGNIVDT